MFRYLSTADQLAGWFNGVHLHPKPHPSLVVVDNYDQYFDSKVRLSQQGVKSHHHTHTHLLQDTGLMAQLSAHIIDGIRYISETKTY